MNPLNHVAIIMDGNGRWGLKNKKNRNEGHKKGLNTAEKIINASIQYNIKYLTLFVFSIDNWKRPAKETSFLFNLLKNYLKKNTKYILDNDIKIKIIGEKNKIQRDLRNKLKYIEIKTKKNNSLTLNLAFNYSSKFEIIHSFKKLIKLKKKISISPDLISKNLYTKESPNPEILIRTGGYSRLSDFLLWQIAYTEIFFIKKLWPDFSNNDLINIIKKFHKIKRNFGTINE